LLAMFDFVASVLISLALIDSLVEIDFTRIV
jgi:hypothetical protein